MRKLTDRMSECLFCRKQKWLSVDAGLLVSTTSSVNDVKSSAKTTERKTKTKTDEHKSQISLFCVGVCNGIKSANFTSC